jgi:hypothetical protein
MKSQKRITQHRGAEDAEIEQKPYSPFFRVWLLYPIVASLLSFTGHRVYCSRHTPCACYFTGNDWQQIFKVAILRALRNSALNFWQEMRFTQFVAGGLSSRLGLACVFLPMLFDGVPRKPDFDAGSSTAPRSRPPSIRRLSAKSHPSYPCFPWHGLLTRRVAGK